MKEEVTYGEFLDHAVDYIKQLLTKPSAAKIDDYLSDQLKERGVDQKGFLKRLLDDGIIERSEKVDDKVYPGHESATFSITYKVPEKRFKHKMKKLHISLFEQNIPEEEMDECTACAGSSGAFETTLTSKPMRRSIYVTQEQLNEIFKMLNESTAGEGVGDIEYDVPFPVDKNDPTMKHNKGKKRGSAENAIGMDRLK